jgi:hypothetical protein
MPVVKKLVLALAQIAKGAEKYPKDPDMKRNGQKAYAMAEALANAQQSKIEAIVRFKQTKYALDELTYEAEDCYQQLKLFLMGRFGSRADIELMEFGIRSKKNRKPRVPLPQ